MTMGKFEYPLLKPESMVDEIRDRWKLLNQVNCFQVLGDVTWLLAELEHRKEEGRIFAERVRQAGWGLLPSANKAEILAAAEDYERALK